MNLNNISQQWTSFVKVYPKELTSMEKLEKRLGYIFEDKSLLFEAMTHRSAVVDDELRRSKKGKKFLQDLRWNERIEFLGDSILGLVISTRLWEKPIASDEGKLSKIRAGLVSEKTLAMLALKIELQDCLILGRGEVKSGGRSRNSLLADSLEALFGAIYLDGGVERATQVINSLYMSLLDQDLSAYLQGDHKTLLQELTQDKFRLTPTYHVVSETGPDHFKTFKVECRVGEKVIGTGIGHSKKKSSQNAAENAYEILTKGKK